MILKVVAKSPKIKFYRNGPTTSLATDIKYEYIVNEIMPRYGPGKIWDMGRNIDSIANIGTRVLCKLHTVS